MTAGSVDGNEMKTPPELDDAVAEALISGAGSTGTGNATLDGHLVDVIGEMRTAFSSPPPVPTPALAAFISGAPAVVAERRFHHLRGRAVAKAAAAIAAAMAATGGLAVAGALPAPAQNAVADAASSVGVKLPHHDTHGGKHHKPFKHQPSATPGSGSTSPHGKKSHTPGSTSGPQAGNHGTDVSTVAKDKSTQGCEHGRAVSAVASGTANDKPCPTASSTPTTEAPSPPSSTAHGSGGISGDEGGDSSPPVDAPKDTHAPSPTPGGNGAGTGHGGSDGQGGAAKSGGSD
jgi:hypothetical protein